MSLLVVLLLIVNRFMKPQWLLHLVITVNMPVGHGWLRNHASKSWIKRFSLLNDCKEICSTRHHEAGAKFLKAISDGISAI